MQLDHTHPVLAGAGYHLPLRGALLGRGAGQRRARRCGPFPSGEDPPGTLTPQLLSSMESPKLRGPQAQDAGRWEAQAVICHPSQGSLGH